MKYLIKLLPLGLTLAGIPLGCSGEDTPAPPGPGNSTTGAGGSSTLSTSSVSASSMGMSGAAVTTQAGPTTSSVGGTTSQGSTGAAGMGGSSTTSGQGGMTSSVSTGQGGMSTETTGAGGSDTTGAMTTGTATTGGGLDAKPSAGCGNVNASPSPNLPNNTILSVPPTHDGSTPVPVIMAFHAAGNPNTQLKDRFGDNWEDKYLVVYPKSAGNEWNNNTDGQVVDNLFNALTNDACIDENRVFATGHSSGAQFIVQRLCAGEKRWRAIAPIASSKYCNSWDPVPALVIHGIGDQERSWDPNGEEDIVPYRTSNGCQQTSTEYPVDGCSSSGTQVDPGCVSFDGCSERTLWCQHNDPQYGTSHHGLPCFADTLIPEFFGSF